MSVQTQSSVAGLIEQGGLATMFVPMTAEEAVALAKDYYQVDGVAHRFETEKDDTFCIQDKKATRYVLKVANPAETEQEIDLQLTTLEHIAAKDPGFPAPRVIRGQRDERLFQHVDGNGQIRLVRMLSYLHGTPLSDTTSTSVQREKVGEILARLRLAMADLSHPLDSRELAWDVKHLPRLTGLAEYIQGGNQDLIHRGLQRFLEIEPRLRGLPGQVLHNDFSRSNIVVDHDRDDFVTGIIDFGDVVRTLVAVDVSTALLNQLPQQYEEDLFSAGRDVLRGYLRVATLTDEELRVIPHLVMARVVGRALITTWRAQQFPDNATYIMRNTYPGWEQLRWFLSRSTDEVSQVLISAVGRQ